MTREVERSTYGLVLRGSDRTRGGGEQHWHGLLAAGAGVFRTAVS